MKAHKKIMIAVALVVALALGGAVLAACVVNGAIPAVTISYHEDGDIEYAGEDTTFMCNGITSEWDECEDKGEWYPRSDGVTITWTATAGTYTDNTGGKAVWTAPAKAPPPSGMVTITATADDDATWANDSAKSDSVSIEVVDCDGDVDYTTGEKCETCEWDKADQFFPYCGTPQYVEVNFTDFVGCGIPSFDKIILIQNETDANYWDVTLNGGVFCTWDVYDDYYYPDHYSSLKLEGVGSCFAFQDDTKPVCYDGKDPIIGEFENSHNCEGGCPCGCGHSGTAKVRWGSDIGHTEFIEQYPLWQESVYYEFVVDPFVADIVQHSNKVYQCIESHTSSQQNKPPNATYWTQLPPLD